MRYRHLPCLEALFRRENFWDTMAVEKLHIFSSFDQFELAPCVFEHPSGENDTIVDGLEECFDVQDFVGTVAPVSEALKIFPRRQLYQSLCESTVQTYWLRNVDKLL